MAEVSKAILDRIDADGKKREEYVETVVPSPDIIDGSELYKVRVRFTSPILGSKPMRRDLFERFLMPKNPYPETDIEDLAMLSHGIRMAHTLVSSQKMETDLNRSFIDPEMDSKGDGDAKDDDSWFDSLVGGMTGFLCDENGVPYLDSYIPSAFMKHVWTIRKHHPNTISPSMRQGKSIITSHISVTGMDSSLKNKIRLNIPKGRKPDVLSRPLHVDTPRGKRTALAVSVVLPVDTWFECKLKVLSPKLISTDILHEWFSYGEYQGFGQFRGGRYGTFDYTMSRLTKR